MGVFDFAKRMTRAAVRTAVLPIDVAKDVGEFFDPESSLGAPLAPNTSKGIDSIKSQVNQAIEELEDD